MRSVTVSININPELAQRLNMLVEQKCYANQEEALEDAVRFLIAVKGKLYARDEIRAVLSRYISLPTDEILADVKTEEEL
ncbi:MAG: ribbon-helix-helix domain-containing protein [Methanoregula sp.]|nr:ribbon-helix-helix domain-containing protein [Methanoregula sp.]